MISIIIVNYYTRHFLSDCLASLSHLSEYEVLIIDNHSQDVSDFQSDWVKVVHNTENIGFARAANQAARQAQGEWLFFLNPDTKIQGDITHVLHSCSDSVGIVGFALEGQHGRQTHQYGFFPQIVHFFSGMHYTLPADRETWCYADWVSGAALAVRREIFHQVKGFDPQFFLYYEDIDLAKRVLKEGFQVIWTPEQTVWHQEGGAQRSLWKMKHRYYQSQRQYLVKWEGRWLAWVLFPIHELRITWETFQDDHSHEFPQRIFVGVLASLIIGQLIAVPGGANLSDGAVAVFLGLWSVWTIKARQRVPITGMLIWGGVFSLYLLGNLLINLDTIASDDYLGSVLYWIRLVVYGSIIFPVSQWVHESSTLWWQRFRRYVLNTALVLSLLGFLQLIFVPDFSFMAEYGWDPHQGRLLSTWYDPNFLGGFLVLALILVSNWLLSLWAQSSGYVLAFVREHKELWFIFILIFLAFVLTFSRSAYLAFVVGMGVLSLLRAPKLILVGGFAFLLSIVFIPRMQERVKGIFTIDATAEMRLDNWRETIDMIEEDVWWGVGYNTLKYQPETSEQVHHAAGRDSSLMTIWLTMGFPGFLLWVGLLIRKMADWLWRGAKSQGQEQEMVTSLVAMMSSLLIHSLFVNSLLYPFILIIMVIMIVL